MISEAAVALALDGDKLPTQGGGVLTTASALGSTLIERLRAKGMTFTVETADDSGGSGSGGGALPVAAAAVASKKRA
jgi:hypothetical protein